ncbi:MAG: hypothetical protein K0V04_29960 [Deltaproteobacteria bacterium]|nr:hypothetical protein [Deltaproteobacteria bacterium]
MDEATLACYQRELLTRLRAGQSPQAIAAALQADPRFAAWRDDLDALDHDALGVAVELVAKWSPQG